MKIAPGHFERRVPDNAGKKNLTVTTSKKLPREGVAQFVKASWVYKSS
jgi:hypothetical protein